MWRKFQNSAAAPRKRKSQPHLDSIYFNVVVFFVFINLSKSKKFGLTGFECVRREAVHQKNCQAGESSLLSVQSFRWDRDDDDDDVLEDPKGLELHLTPHAGLHVL